MITLTITYDGEAYDFFATEVARLAAKQLVVDVTTDDGIVTPVEIKRLDGDPTEVGAVLVGTNWDTKQPVSIPLYHDEGACRVVAVHLR